MKKLFCLLTMFVLLCTITCAYAASEEWVCPVCKQTRTTEFCSKCGTRRTASDSWYCPKCGKKLTGEDNFCPNDGTPKQTNTAPAVRNLNDLPILRKVNTLTMAGGDDNVVVYTGPGSEYYRSASGKAAVYGSAKVAAFGRIGDWVLIRYDAVISSSNKDVARFAYAPVSKVRGGYDIQEIELAALPITISEGAHLVDEPSLSHYFTSMSAIRYTDAIALAQITEGGYTWIYFETCSTTEQGTRPFRGFVQIQNVRTR